MCGIVLAGSSAPLSVGESNIFEQMLFSDTFRGEHSTGVIAGYRKPEYSNTTLDVFTAKAAVTAPEFLKSDAWKGIISRTAKTTTATGTTTYSTSRRPKFLIGHNRHATKGAKTAQNAHPFTHGHITLVHNGTLVDQSLLPEHKRFEVDSENIAYALSVLPAAEVIQKLDGAFTLIWFNAQEQKVHVIRNDERPFHFAEGTSPNTWFGASEEEMLKWIITRQSKYTWKRTSPGIKRYFEAEVGVEYVFDVSGANFKLVEEIKHELPKFPKYSGGYGFSWADNYASGYSNRGTTQKPSSAISNRSSTVMTHNAVEMLLSKHGAKGKKAGDTAKFYTYQFDPYLHRPDFGVVRGYFTEIETANDYVEVILHNFPKCRYQEYKNFKATILSAYKDRNTNVLQVIMDPKNMVSDLEEDRKDEERAKRAAESKGKKTEPLTVSMVSEEPVVEPPSEDDEYDTKVMTDDGDWWTKDEWNSSTNQNSTCVSCRTFIPFSEADLAVSHQDGFICWSCNDRIAAEISVSGVSVLSSDDGFVETFNCVGCATDYTLDELADGHEDLCCECADHYGGFKGSGSKPFDEKMVGSDLLTEKEWRQINSCSHCNQDIDWKDAEECEVVGNGTVICPSCLANETP